MALTLNAKAYTVIGNYAMVIGALTFDSSYTYGGMSINTEQMLGMHSAGMAIFDQRYGQPYQFQYDQVNKKIKVFAEAPPIVIDKVQTIASNAITLDYPAAYIMSIGQATTGIKMTVSTATLAAGEAQPSAVFTAGTRPTINFHTALSGAVYVTYITQAWAEVWANLVQEEVQAVAANTCNLTNQAVAVQCVRSIGTTSTNSCTFMTAADTVSTTNVKMDFSSTNKALTFVAGDAITSCVTTYIKKPASGILYNRFVATENMTAAANVCTPAYPILLWGYGSQALETGVATSRATFAASPGASLFKLDMIGTGAARSTRLVENGCTTGVAMYVWGRWEEIATVPLEVKNGTDLSALITGVAFIGI